MSKKQLSLLKVHHLSPEEEMRHLTICDRVMREKGKVMLNAVQCMLSGNPRVGKSTLLARLTGMELSIIHPEGPDFAKESQTVQEAGRTSVSASTGVLNAVVRVTVKKVRMVVAMARALQPGLIWERIEFDVEAIALLKSVTKDRISHSPQRKQSLALEGATKDKGTDKTRMASSSTSTPAENEPQSERSAHSGLQPFFRFGKRKVSASSTSTVPGFKAPLDIFKEALRSEKWGEVEAFIKDSLTIYFTDTGGQPEFQEVLPALISGPSLFFLVFKLIDDLNQRYQVQFVSPSQKSRPYVSSFTVKETLLQSLASIASTCSYASHTSKKMIAIKPHVVLVATHEDQASQAQIRAIQQELKETLEKTEYYRQNILVFASEDEPVFTVNNISSDGRDIDKIRSIVERIAKHPSFHIEVPLPWLVSSLAFRLLQVPVISYEQCTSVASECGIDTPEELKEALWFLHHKVGFIRYFESVPELRDMVILDPQILFDRITELISGTFTFEQVGPHEARQFRQTGIFPLRTIKDITARSSEYLSSVRLVALLESLHIIAPIRGKTGEVEKYFLPCVLSHASPKTTIRKEASSEVPPLFITFRCGYCPKGVFSALIVHLMSKHNNGGKEIIWRLMEKEVSRHQVTFNVGQEFHTVSIKTHCTHLEVLVWPTTKASANVLQTSPHEVCNSIRQCIDEGIVAVSQTLHYSCDSAFYYSFGCTCSEQSDHPAVCYDKDPCIMVCSKSQEPCDLPENCRIWFGHPVSNINVLLHDKCCFPTVISTHRFKLLVLCCRWLKIQLLNGVGKNKDTLVGTQLMIEEWFRIHFASTNLFIYSLGNYNVTSALAYINIYHRCPLSKCGCGALQRA